MPQSTTCYCWPRARPIVLFLIYRSLTQVVTCLIDWIKASGLTGWPVVLWWRRRRHHHRLVALLFFLLLRPQPAASAEPLGWPLVAALWSAIYLIALRRSNQIRSDLIQSRLSRCRFHQRALAPSSYLLLHLKTPSTEFIFYWLLGRRMKKFLFVCLLECLTL